MNIEMEMYHSEIDYQDLSIKEADLCMSMICNDSEERQHIFNMLMNSKYILCFEAEGKRWWGRFADYDDKETHRLVIKQQRLDR